MSNKITAIDLHTHTLSSDGSFTPSELVDAAISEGLSAIAITDHDTTAGINEAITYAKDKPLRIIPGIELSTSYESTDIHIVGLFVNPTSEILQQQLKEIIKARTIRNNKMCTCFEKYGIYFTLDDLIMDNPNSVITRAHYAKYLYKHGHIKSIKEAFDRYISDHGPCFIPREHISAEDGIKIILEAGGLPVLAHPVLYALSNNRLEALISSLANVGLVGIETTYSTYSSGDTARMKKLANKYSLLESGGSDFHGTIKPTISIGSGRGKLFVPSTYLEAFELRLTTNT